MSDNVADVEDIENVADAALIGPLPNNCPHRLTEPGHGEGDGGSHPFGRLSRQGPVGDGFDVADVGNVENVAESKSVEAGARRNVAAGPCRTRQEGELRRKIAARPSTRTRLSAALRFGEIRDVANVGDVANVVARDLRPGTAGRDMRATDGHHKRKPLRRGPASRRGRTRSRSPIRRGASADRRRRSPTGRSLRATRRIELGSPTARYPSGTPSRRYSRLGSDVGDVGDVGDVAVLGIADATGSAAYTQASTRKWNR